MPSSACPQSCFTTCDITSSEGSIYDANRNIEMPLSSEDVCDINTESTIEPTSGQSTALAVNNSINALAMVSTSIRLLTSTLMSMIVYNNTLLIDIHSLVEC